jgi:hypothetical protein
MPELISALSYVDKTGGRPTFCDTYLFPVRPREAHVQVHYLRCAGGWAEPEEGPASGLDKHILDVRGLLRFEHGCGVLGVRAGEGVVIRAGDRGGPARPSRGVRNISSSASSASRARSTTGAANDRSAAGPKSGSPALSMIQGSPSRPEPPVGSNFRPFSAAWSRLHRKCGRTRNRRRFLISAGSSPDSPCDPRPGPGRPVAVQSARIARSRPGRAVVRLGVAWVLVGPGRRRIARFRDHAPSPSGLRGSGSKPLSDRVRPPRATSRGSHVEAARLDAPTKPSADRGGESRPSDCS